MDGVVGIGIGKRKLLWLQCGNAVCHGNFTEGDSCILSLHLPVWCCLHPHPPTHTLNHPHA